MSPAQVPAVDAVVTPDTVLQLKRFAGGQRMFPAPDIPLHIVRMDQLSPAPAFDLLKSKSGEFSPLPVKISDPAAGCGGENFLRHGFRHEAHALDGFAQSLGRLPAFQCKRKLGGDGL